MQALLYLFADTDTTFLCHTPPHTLSYLPLYTLHCTHTQCHTFSWQEGSRPHLYLLQAATTYLPAFRHHHCCSTCSDPHHTSTYTHHTPFHNTSILWALQAFLDTLGYLVSRHTPPVPHLSHLAVHTLSCRSTPPPPCPFLLPTVHATVIQHHKVLSCCTHFPFWPHLPALKWLCLHACPVPSHLPTPACHCLPIASACLPAHLHHTSQPQQSHWFSRLCTRACCGFSAYTHTPLFSNIAGAMQALLAAYRADDPSTRPVTISTFSCHGVCPAFPASHWKGGSSGPWTFLRRLVPKRHTFRAARPHHRHTLPAFQTYTRLPSHYTSRCCLLHHHLPHTPPFPTSPTCNATIPPDRSTRRDRPSPFSFATVRRAPTSPACPLPPCSGPCAGGPATSPAFLGHAA